MIDLARAICDYKEKNKLPECRVHSLFESYAATARKKNKADEVFTSKCPIMFYPENVYQYAPRKALWYIWNNSDVDIPGYGNLECLFDSVAGYTNWFGLLLLNTGKLALFWYPDESDLMREWRELDDSSLFESIGKYEAMKNKSRPEVVSIGRFYDVRGNYEQKEYLWEHLVPGLVEEKIRPDIIDWCAT